MEIDKIPQWILALEPEDAAFLKNFVLKSGSLKEIARLYEVSYPTVGLDWIAHSKNRIERPKGGRAVFNIYQRVGG